MSNYIIAIILAAIIVALIALRKMRIYYQCDKCGQIFSLSFFVAVFTPNVIFKKLVRCPICGEITWATPIPKEK